MEKKNKFIIIIATIVCSFLFLVAITPLFGIEEPMLFLIVAVPTCAILSVFVLKARFDLFHK